MWDSDSKKRSLLYQIFWAEMRVVVPVPVWKSFKRNLITSSPPPCSIFKSFKRKKYSKKEKEIQAPLNLSPSSLVQHISLQSSKQPLIILHSFASKLHSFISLYDEPKNTLQTITDGKWQLSKNKWKTVAIQAIQIYFNTEVLCDYQKANHIYIFIQLILI